MSVIGLFATHYAMALFVKNAMKVSCKCLFSVIQAYACSVASITQLSATRMHITKEYTNKWRTGNLWHAIYLYILFLLLTLQYGIYYMWQYLPQPTEIYVLLILNYITKQFPNYIKLYNKTIT